MRAFIYVILQVTSLCGLYAETEYGNYFRMLDGQVRLEEVTAEIPPELPRLHFFRSDLPSGDYLVIVRNEQGIELIVDEISKERIKRSRYFDRWVRQAPLLTRTWEYDDRGRLTRVVTTPEVSRIGGSWAGAVVEINYPASGNARYQETITWRKKEDGEVQPTIVTGELDAKLNLLWQNVTFVYRKFAIKETIERKYRYLEGGRIVEQEDYVNGFASAKVTTEFDSFGLALVKHYELLAQPPFSERADRGARSIGSNAVLTIGADKRDLSLATQLFVVNVIVGSTSRLTEGFYWLPLSYFPIPKEGLYRYSEMFALESQSLQ